MNKNNGFMPLLAVLIVLTLVGLGAVAIILVTEAYKWVVSC
jgi:hypothetical protein